MVLIVFKGLLPANACTGTAIDAARIPLSTIAADFVILFLFIFRIPFPASSLSFRKTLYIYYIPVSVDCN